VSVIRQTTWALGFQLVDPITGVPIDLTGATARMTIRNAAGEIVLELDETNGITVGTNTGFVDFEVTPAQTAALALQRHTYNLDATVGSRTYAVARGNIKVLDNTNIPDPAP
jgi:hypothetical protein